MAKNVTAVALIFLDVSLIDKHYNRLIYSYILATLVRLTFILVDFNPLVEIRFLE